jgi:hypothetical protein
MWWVEGYCDMHQQICLFFNVIGNTFIHLVLLKCSVYVSGACVPPNFSHTITISEGYMYIYQSVAANSVLSTQQNIGSQGQNN